MPEEIAETQRIAQLDRLSRTKVGRDIVDDLRIERSNMAETKLPIPEQVRHQTRIDPMPKNMNPDYNKRRVARAKALIDQHANNENTRRTSAKQPRCGDRRSGVLRRKGPHNKVQRDHEGIPPGSQDCPAPVLKSESSEGVCARARVPYDQTEELVYLSNKLRCAVMKIQIRPGPMTVYDVVVRNSSIERGPSRGCINKLLRMSGYVRGTFQPKNARQMIVHTPGTFRSYDLRVRNSSVEKGPRKDCVRKFKRRDSRGQVIYRPLCQDLFQVKAPNALPTSTTKAPPVTVPQR
ncbi:hypothetical protein HPB50_020849 [Hyalomma asiaticum]|uniref:Uncharacterized protein n=1 Tax=Hyalomma asiaticum TaxID=266040 RepID=A0ACB7RVW1_HYAAI|nr:hypothetical protein HPB50_020849 [Hyalomma asiaticum]